MIVIRAILIVPIRFYQWFISPLIGPCCRFHPSCSHYAAESIGRHGFWRGARLTLWRLARCHPWGGQGFDPVPEVMKNIKR